MKDKIHGEGNYCNGFVCILDADDFEPSIPAAVPAVAIKSDKWDGEDEDEPVKVLS